MTDEPNLARIEAALARMRPASGGRGHHSALYRWMRERRQQMAALLRREGVTWQAIAEALAAEGLRDGAGCPPTADRVRKTWKAVCAAPTIEAERARKRAEAEAKRPHRVEVLVQHGDHVTALPVPPPDAPPAQNASAEIAKIRAEMDARSGRSPPARSHLQQQLDALKPPLPPILD